MYVVFNRMVLFFIFSIGFHIEYEILLNGYNFFSLCLNISNEYSCCGIAIYETDCFMFL